MAGETGWRWARAPRRARGPGGTVPAGPTRDTALVMPDISGYTRFLHLSRFAEAHAQHIVTELLQAMIAAAAPSLTAAKVEGDAVLLYAPLEGPQARSPAEVARAVEALLQAFYRRLDELERSNLCHCACCQHLDDLDIKAILHRGPVTAYRLERFTELSGMPVVVTHRLLKNSARTPRYLLVTDAARALVPPFAGAGRATSEPCPDIGPVSCTLHGFDRDEVTPAELPAPDVHPLRCSAAKLAANLRSLWPHGRARRGG
jgi:class 3 adenylate cyclase